MNKPLFPEVTVNGRVIPAADIAAEAQNQPAPPGKPGLAWRKAARALVIRALLLEEAARQRLTPDPQELGPGLRESDDEALIRAVTEAGIRPAPVSDEEIRSVYDANPGQYRSPDLWEAAHILFAADPQDKPARAKARVRAEAAAQRLAERPDDFAVLASEQSDCPSRDAGGRLGQIGPGDTVAEFEAALAQLEPGEFTRNPVQSRYGFHIIRLLASAEGAALPFETVAPDIRTALEKKAWVRAAHDYVKTLAASATITGIEMDVPIA